MIHDQGKSSLLSFYEKYAIEFEAYKECFASSDVKDFDKEHP